MYPFIQRLHPHLLLERIPSNFNDLIEIYSEFGRPRIVADGMPQSGGIVTDILKKSLNHFNHPHTFLLLGLGGGDILHHIRRRWPDCQITAIEIDPAMIDIAKKYFKISKIPHLQIINDDAYKYIFNETSKRRNVETIPFDAILIDCYLGRQIPLKLESPIFLKNLKKLLSPSGTIAFNRLYNQQQTKNQILINKLKEVFPLVNTYKAYCNMLIVAKNVVPANLS